MTAPCLRVSVRLAKYPASEGTTVYRWSTRPLADTGAWTEGRIRSIGDITRSCTDQDGNYELASVSCDLADDDGLFRGLLDGATTQYWLGRETTIELLSEAGRSAGSTWRPLFRGVITSVQLTQGHGAQITVGDLVGSKFSAFDLERAIGVPIGDEHTALPDASKGRIYPIIVGEHSDLGAVDVNGHSAGKGLLPVIDTGDYRIDGSAEPVSVLPPPTGLSVTVVGTPGSRRVTYAISTGSATGESTKCDDVTIPNAPDTLNGSNYVRVTWDAVTGATFYRVWGRTSDNTWIDGMNNGGTYVDPETEYHDDNDADIEKGGPNVDTNTAVDDGVWGRLVVSIGVAAVHQVFASNLNDGGTPARAEIDASLDGVEYLTSDSAGWPHAVPYLDLVNPVTGETIRQTVIYVRGPRLAAHRQGSVTIAVNGCGMESVGDGTGTLVDEAFKVGQLFLNEHVLKNGGTGYRTGVYGPLEAYSNGDKQVWTSAWAAAQTITVNRIGGTGYIAAWAVHEAITVREWVRRFCLTFDCRLAVNHFGQVYPVLVDDLADAATGRLYREWEEGVDLVDQQLAYDELENRITFSFDWDSDAQAYRVTDQVIEDADSIAAHVPGGVSGAANLRGVLVKSAQELYCTRDATTALDSRGRRLTRNKRVPRYVTHAQNLIGVEDDLGDHIRLTNRDGLGAIGDVLTPCCVVRHTVVPSALLAGAGATRLVGIDLGRLLDNNMTMTGVGALMTATGFEMR